jgi:PAS domain S-box-containing protein
LLGRALRDAMEKPKRAQALRRQDDAASDEAQRHPQVGEWRWSLERDELVSCSEDYARIHGVSLEEIHALGKGQREWVVHLEDRNRVAEAFRSAGQEGRDYEIDYRILRPDGELRRVREVGKAVLDSSDRPVEYQGTLQDITEREQTERQLRKTLSQLQHVQRIAKLEFWVWDAREDKLDMPEGNPMLVGFSRDEVAGLSDGEYIERFVHPDDRQRVREAYGPALVNDRPIDVEYRLIRSDGKVLFVHEVGEPVFDQGGEVVGQIGTLQDITERKRAEDALRTSEARFRDFTETASDWFWEMGETLRFTYLSDRFEEATGVPIKDVIGLTREELYDRHMAASDKGNREKWQAHHNQIEARQAYRDFEVTWRYPDRTERTFAHSGKPVLDETGAFRGYRGTGVEITDRKKAETALREGERRFRGLFEQSAVGMAHAAPDGRVLEVNQAYSDFTGYAISELIGKRFDQVVHPDDLESAAAHRRSVLDGKAENPMHERRYLRKSGEQRWGLAGVAPFRDENGVLEGYIVQVQDITERKRIEAEIRRLNEELEERVDSRTAELRETQEELVRKERLAALGKLTGTVSHELRNPLGAMRTSLATIRKLARGGEPILERSVEILDNSVSRCDSIISDLLDYSRVRDLAPSVTVVDEWLNALLDEYQMPPGITLCRELGAGAIIALDRDRLSQVVNNLLDNACQAMLAEDNAAPGDAERRVTVATSLSGGRVELSVSDTGPGIPPAELEKVFEPLYSTKAFGVGLGLPLVRQIVEQHGGRIEADRTVGHGTRMVLWLPTEGEPRNAAQ